MRSRDAFRAAAPIIHVDRQFNTVDRNAASLALRLGEPAFRDAICWSGTQKRLRLPPLAFKGRCENSPLDQWILVLGTVSKRFVSIDRLLARGNKIANGGVISGIPNPFGHHTLAKGNRR